MICDDKQYRLVYNCNGKVQPGIKAVEYEIFSHIQKYKAPNMYQILLSMVLLSQSLKSGDKEAIKFSYIFFVGGGEKEQITSGNI